MRKTTNFKRYERGGAVPLSVEVNTPAAYEAADKATEALLEAVAPDSREATIQRWQRAGMTDNQAAFLRENSDLVDAPDVLEAATSHAHMKGHEVDTPEYFDEIRAYGDRHSAPSEDEPVAKPIKTSAPTEPDDYEPSERNFSGPISLKMTERSSPGTYNSNGERSGQVRMTAQMKEHAKAAGISDLQYAEGVLRLREEKNNGRYGGEP